MTIVGPCTAVLSQPQSTTICPHDTTRFRFVVDGVPNLIFQWRREGVPIEDGTTPTGSIISGTATDTLTITNVQFSDAASYDCVVSSPIGLCTGATSQPARLDIGELCCSLPYVVTGTFLRVNGDPNATDPQVFDLFDCGFSCGMSFRWRVYGGGYNPCGDTTNPQTDFIGVFSSSPTVLPNNQQFRIPGAVGSGQPNFPTDPTPNGGLPTDIPQDFLLSNNGTYSIPCGARYLIAAPKPFNCSPGPGSNTRADDGGNDGWTIRLPICGHPTVSKQPVSTRGCVGGSTTLSVTAANWGPWTYRWRKNGTPINVATNPSAATSSLTLSNLQASDIASYDCVINNNCWNGSVTSDPANVTLDTALPVFTAQPSPTLSCPTSSSTFSVMATATGPVTYQWQIQTSPPPSESWLSLTSDPTPLPCGATSYATATPANAATTSIFVRSTCPTPPGTPPGAPTRWPIRCIVTNACGSVTSNTATLTICPADFNCANGVTVQDIFDFLSAWFAAAPNADFNSVNGITVQDIFDFLAAWFAGC